MEIICQNNYMFLCITFAFLFLSSKSITASPSMYNVVSFGAHSDGSVDSTAAFMKTWDAACRSISPSHILVPRGRFLVKQMTFKGLCMNHAITFIIHGVLLAPSDYRVLAYSDNWISFYGVDGVSVIGGVLVAQSTALWACKVSGNNCPTGTTTLKIINSRNVFINHVTSLNSQLFHIVIYGSNNVTLQSIKIRAPGNSPNTDGIHIQFSAHISILNSNISTGDDCISIGPGTKHIHVEKILCGPGHGISIGSLGRQYVEQGVKNVTVTGATFFNTQNGFRIKTWGRQSNAFVKGVIFQHATMINVYNPILIDQYYCPDHNNCPKQNSGVKITDVTYQDIHGSSAKQVAVNFSCSKSNPCSEIKLQDVVLSYRNRQPKSLCRYAYGTETGRIHPQSCLYN